MKEVKSSISVRFVTEKHMDNITAQLNVVNLCLILQLKTGVIPCIIPQADNVNSNLHRQLNVHAEKDVGPGKLKKPSPEKNY